MSSVRWRIFEVEKLHWWVVDIPTGVAYAVPSDVGERLWRLHCLMGVALPAAIERARSNLRPSRFVDLHFNGTTMRYLCETEELEQRFSLQFDGLLSTLRSSPDVLVRISDGVDFDRLHRAVGTKREFVQIRDIAEEEWMSGSSDVPIIPAMQCKQMEARYTALHAALIRTASGGLMFCGAQRSGKTSAATIVERSELGSILTDETVLIDQSGLAYGLPLAIQERTETGRRARPLLRSSGSAKLNALEVRTIVVLSASNTKASYHTSSSVAESLKLLSPHLRPLDGPLGNATTKLMLLLRDAKVHLWRVRPWPELRDDLHSGIRSLLEDKHGQAFK
jgi:hypothetical protein